MAPLGSAMCAFKIDQGYGWAVGSKHLAPRSMHTYCGNQCRVHKLVMATDMCRLALKMRRLATQPWASQGSPWECHVGLQNRSRIRVGRPGLPLGVPCRPSKYIKDTGGPPWGHLWYHWRYHVGLQNKSRIRVGLLGLPLEVPCGPSK